MCLHTHLCTSIHLHVYIHTLTRSHQYTYTRVQVSSKAYLEACQKVAQKLAYSILGLLSLIACLFLAVSSSYALSYFASDQP